MMEPEWSHASERRTTVAELKVNVNLHQGDCLEGSSGGGGGFKVVKFSRFVSVSKLVIFRISFTK